MSITGRVIGGILKRYQRLEHAEKEKALKDFLKGLDQDSQFVAAVGLGSFKLTRVYIRKDEASPWWLFGKEAETMEMGFDPFTDPKAFNGWSRRLKNRKTGVTVRPLLVSGSVIDLRKFEFGEMIMVRVRTHLEKKFGNLLTVAHFGTRVTDHLENEPKPENDRFERILNEDDPPTPSETARKR